MATEMISAVWPEWKVEKVLGKGSYGTVYQAIRSDSNIQSKAAIKVISIPNDPAELASLRAEGLTEENTKTYFQGIVNDFVGEIQLMEALKGTQNIVSVEDYKVVERQNEIGWEIYIRMELLHPFNDYICNRQLSEQEVLKLGIDICSALEICSRRSIVHRDIKPENIFVNDFGDFKLGDFGIARTLENSTGGLSQKGTFNYMAPEIASGRNYDARVDIYSLGIVLYRLLNANRLPFIESDDQLLNPNARKMAVDRRMRGDQMSLPCCASPNAAAVIMQACAYSPQVRFASATEMKRALQQVLDGTYVMTNVDLDRTVAVRHAAVNLDGTVGANAGWNPQQPAPQVQGWSQVPVQQPNYAPAQQPNYAPVQQPNYAPVQQPVQQPNYAPVQQQKPVQQPVQQPNYTPVQQPAYPNMGQVPPKTNNMCLLSCLVGAFVLFLALIESALGILGLAPLGLAVAGKAQLKTTNTTGNGLAWAGLALGGLDLTEGLMATINEPAGLFLGIIAVAACVLLMVRNNKK